MPYLHKTFREEIQLATDLDNLTFYLANLKDEDFAGAWNFLNYKICKEYLREKGNKYWRFCIVVGTMILCLLELWRRVISPYEDQKIKENGDV